MGAVDILTTDDHRRHHHRWNAQGGQEEAQQLGAEAALAKDLGWVHYQL